MASRGGPSKETLERVKAREADLQAQTQRVERQYVHGRWVSDEVALRNREVRQREAVQRQAPRRLARASVYAHAEDVDTGLQLDAHEVADRVTQDDLVAAVDVQTQRKRFDLVLDKLGPYKIDFTTNGSHLLLAGLRGHLANLHWQSFALHGEVQLKDKISDAVFLVDHTMTAVAQKRYVYMYTKEGTEMHILSRLAHMDRLTYLPRHLLLAATSSTYSALQYLDISTGVELGTKPPSVLRDPAVCVTHNPSNGVVATCDVRGVVKFWSPSVADALVQMKAHAGVIEDVAFHPNGRFLLTLGGDHKLKVWDCRTLRALDEYAVAQCCHSLAVSRTGLVALGGGGGGTAVQIWRDMFMTSSSSSSLASSSASSSTAQRPCAPYMQFGLGYGHVVHHVRFCPFEDVLGVGHARGFVSLLVPGAGEANPDVYYANPHETERHRKERVVGVLLDKLPPDTISMDVQVPGVNEARLAAYEENVRLNRKAMAIRAKKERRARRAVADGDATAATAAARRAPTGLLSSGDAAHHDGNDDDDDELDEEIGYKERPVTRELKTRQERAAAKKAARWDKKDSADKVRSKQTMRQSRLVQRTRATRAREAADGGAYDRDALDDDEAAALAAVEARAARVRARRRAAAEDAADDVRGVMRSGAPPPSATAAAVDMGLLPPTSSSSSRHASATPRPRRRRLDDNDNDDNNNSGSRRGVAVDAVAREAARNAAFRLFR